MTPSLREVAAFSNVADAELARCRLEQEGIPARLDNAAVAGLFWHLSQAAGGVSVLVPAEHAIRAADVLGRSELEDEGASWSCPRCRESLPGAWDKCWRCGTTKEGVQDADFVAESAERDASEDACEPKEVCGAAVWVGGFAGFFVGMLAGSWLLGLAAWLVTLAIAAFFARRAGDLDARKSAVRDHVAGAGPEPAISTRQEGRQDASDLTKKAWRTAVLGTFLCPLFAAYALVTLARINPARSRLRPLDWARYCVAWGLGLVSLALLILVLQQVWGGFSGDEVMPENTVVRTVQLP